MDSVFLKEEDCCGCTACMNVCPKNAITMSSDKQGFYYPKIDSDKCIDCGLCRKTCQFGWKEINGAYNSVNCYAVKHKDSSVIKASRSAGAFTALSDCILTVGGVIYGAVLNSDMTVSHNRAEIEKQRNQFRESKYVQSDLTGVFAKVADDLSANKTVMFSGTGCQCDGLRSFLQTKRIDMGNLLLVDIVCHGVPSPQMFAEYIKWNERKVKSAIKNFKFRDKRKYNWSDGIEKLSFANGKTIYQDYFTGYIFTNFARTSCYNCKYTTPYRNSDITLADFWGSENSCPEFTDYKNGCSLVLIHSEKGKDLFKKIQDTIDFKEIDIDKCLQPRLQTPREKTPATDFLWKEYCDKGFDYIMSKYATNSLSMKERFMRNVCRFINRINKVVHK